MSLGHQVSCGARRAKVDGVLAGAAADLQDVAARARQERGNRRPDRLVIAVEGRRVQPAVRRGRRCRFCRNRRRIQAWLRTHHVLNDAHLAMPDRRGQRRIRRGLQARGSAFVVFMRYDRAKFMRTRRAAQSPRRLAKRPNNKIREDQNAQTHHDAGGACRRRAGAAGCGQRADRRSSSASRRRRPTSCTCR